MGKKSLIITVIMLLACGQVFGAVKEKLDGAGRTVLYKGEHVIGLSASYYDLSSVNSDILLLISDLGAKASYLGASAAYQYAYKDNMSVGVRFKYNMVNGGLDNVNLNLLSQSLAFDVKDLKVKTNSIGATLFNRIYFGLDRKGTVGLYLEQSLGYKRNYTFLGPEAGNAHTVGDQFRLGLAPGIILYVLPFVSLQAQIGIASVDYSNYNCYQDNQKIGHLAKWGGSLKFNLPDMMFGINFHF